MSYILCKQATKQSNYVRLAKEVFVVIGGVRVFKIPHLVCEQFQIINSYQLVPADVSDALYTAPYLGRAAAKLSKRLSSELN